MFFSSFFLGDLSKEDLITFSDQFLSFSSWAVNIYVSLGQKIDDLVKSRLGRHCEESARGGRRYNLMKSMSYKEQDCFAPLAMTLFRLFTRSSRLTKADILDYD
jgi:hypothetical protein